MLSRELSILSETSRCGNEISEYICSTFLGEPQKTIACHYGCYIVSFVVFVKIVSDFRLYLRTVNIISPTQVNN